MQFPLFKRKLIRGVKEHIDAGLSAACDYVANYETIYAPCGGTIYTFKEIKGGNWIGIKRDNGDKIEMAHIDKYLVKQGWLFKTRVEEGQPIAISGNTGTQTTGPHLHLQVIKNNQRVDPEEYFIPKSIPLIVINGLIPFMQEFQKILLDLSAGMLTCTWDIINHPISVNVGMLDQNESYNITDQLFDRKYLPYRYIFMIYQGNPTSAFLASYYYPKLNNCISTIISGSNPRLMVFEFSHQLQIFYNTNRGSLPGIEIMDSNFPDDNFIIKKLRSVLPYIDILLKK